MRLWLIRHGQTPSNVLGLLDTAVPGPSLTDLGREQAAALPAALADSPLGAVYASAQTRAQETAAPLAAARGLQVLVRPGLGEVQAGNLEMAGDRESVLGYLSVIGRWMAGELEMRHPGNGESGHEVLARYDEVVAEAAGTGAEAVAMLSHGAVIRFWATYRSGNLPAAFGARHVLHNTGVVELEGHPDCGWRTLTWAVRAVGGMDLDDPQTDGPAGDPFEVRSALPHQ